MTTDAATPPSPADLLAWAAGQTAAFHSALAAAVKTYAATGAPPKVLAAGASSSDDGPKKRAKKDKNAPKRPPTPYNIFVKERAAVLKEKGFDAKAEDTTLMSKVADEWKAMSAEQKEAFTANAIARGKAVAPKRASPPPGGALAAPTTPAGGGHDADDEERRRKKAEKRARKEAAKAAALAAGGEPASKKHKHSHHE